MIPRTPSITLLAIASGTSPFGMAIVLPALPEIVNRFDSGYAIVQMVVSGYLLGVALAQPVSGVLCDRFGRRRILLAGFSIFIVASIGCSTAATLQELVAFRFLQAVGASTGTVASRAVVRDVFSVAASTRALSRITIGLGIAPVIAPMIGGWLSVTLGVNAIFITSAVIGAIVLLSIAICLPETRERNGPATERPAALVSYGRLLRSRPFIGYTLIFGFVQGSFFAFLAVGAAVFADSFDMGASTFGLVWGGMAIAYVLGAMLGGRLSLSSVSAAVLPASLLLTLVLGQMLLAGVVIVGVSPLSVLLPMVGLMAVSGAATPLVMAGAVNHHPDIAGTSAGLSSAIGLVVGNVFVVLSGLLYSGNFLPIAALIAASTALTAASWLIVRRVDIAPEAQR